MQWWSNADMASIFWTSQGPLMQSSKLVDFKWNTYVNDCIWNVLTIEIIHTNKGIGLFHLPLLSQVAYLMAEEAFFRASLVTPHFLWVLPLKWTVKQQQRSRTEKQSLSSIIQSASCLSERRIFLKCLQSSFLLGVYVWFCLCCWQSTHTLSVIRESCRFVCVCVCFDKHHAIWAIQSKSFQEENLGASNDTDPPFNPEGKSEATRSNNSWLVLSLNVLQCTHDVTPPSTLTASVSDRSVSYSTIYFPFSKAASP